MSQLELINGQHTAALENLLKTMMQSDSFQLIMSEAMEQATAHLKTRLANKLSEAIVDSIDIDDIARDAIDRVDLASTITDSVSEKLEDAVRGVF